MEIIQSQNILNWYPFKKTDNILEIGENSKELTELFKEKCANVTTIITFNEETLNNEQYDYITLIGITENWKEVIGQNIKFEELLKRLEKYLKPEGKILIAIDNKFGLRFFAGNPEKILNKKFESLIGYNNEFEKIETFTKTKMESILQNLGYNTRFYYPLPDYKMPNVIFSDEQLPEYNSIDKYNPYFLENSDIIFNEIDVFREILKTDKNMFTFFANSFLIEATKGECNKEYKYISFNNLRKEEYRLITKISDSYVEKQKITKESELHYQNIKDNIKMLEDNEIKSVDYIENDIIKSKYTDQKYLLNNVLTEKLEQGKKEEFFEIIDNYIKIISKNSYKEIDYEKTVFGKYNIETENKKLINNLNFLEKGLWDMTFKNCFLVNDEFLFFDQEWKEANIPVEYILYRSIYYTISLRRFIKIDDLFEKYNLAQYIELFKKLDDELQKKIRDYETWEFYSENHYFNIDDTKQEVINLNIRSTAQDDAIKNLQKENEELKKKNIDLQIELNNTFSRKIKVKLGRFFPKNN